MEPRTVQRAFIIPIDTVTPPSKTLCQKSLYIRCESPLKGAVGIQSVFGGGGGSRTRVWQWKPRLHTVISRRGDPWCLGLPAMTQGEILPLLALPLRFKGLFQLV